MKQIHAVLRLLICLLLTIAYAKQPPPASPEYEREPPPSLTGASSGQADADAVPGDVDFSSFEVAPDGGRTSDDA